jgi:hypothetical protein
MRVMVAQPQSYYRHNANERPNASTAPCSSARAARVVAVARVGWISLGLLFRRLFIHSKLQYSPGKLDENCAERTAL